MQSKRFSQLTIAITVIVSLIIVFWLVQEAAKVIPMDIPADISTTTAP